MNASHETRHMLDAADLRALAEARVLLERPSLAARLSSFVGSPLEKGMARLPASWRERIGGLAHDALMKAMDTAAKTLQPAAQPASPRLHKLLGSVSGAGGGAFGVAGLTVEIPLSTVLIMRSILDIARAEGEDIGSAQARLAALEVFALGGNASSDDAAEAGYYAVRAALATTVSEAARHFAQKGLSSEGAPALARLITMVAARYKVQLTQKAAGMLVPGIGAAAGATINLMFMDHFQAVSRGHFTVRRLERRYGEEAVRAAWQAVGRPHPGNRSGFP
ncbi:MAG TPA: EcsC family protein [Thauera aminoaromatica]|uniref:EcsC family protein n=1 Tax=Thauera sp. TaxID=1905334 RepID=UPI00110D75A3|nr:EcsC family protein [Thauera sp.]MBP7048160.1 EcsC family protein [Thauera sp.]TMW75297.1 EcsC family protein [Thauera sp. UPWRP]HMV93389.1 EcsC family protein [Thauera aminoaromatica]